MNSVLAGLSCSRGEAYEFAMSVTQDDRWVSRDGTAETKIWVIELIIVSKQMILDGVRGKNGSILVITDKHCWTKAGALGDT